MGMIGSAVGAGMKAAGAIAGGIIQRKAMDTISGNIGQLESDNLDWYNRRSNEDATQRADFQRLYNLALKAGRENNRAAAGAAAVGGATEESIAATKAANNQMLADLTAQQAAQFDAKKDAIEQQYMGTKAELINQKNALEQQKAAATQQAVQGVADAAGSIAKVF